MIARAPDTARPDNRTTTTKGSKMKTTATLATVLILALLALIQAGMVYTALTGGAI